jgi:hypothetical protein
MGDLISIHAALHEKDRAKAAKMAQALRALADKAERGELQAVAFVGLPADGQTLSIGAIHDGHTGLHEVIGATTILNDYLRRLVFN